MCGLHKMPGTTIFAGLPTKLRLLSNHSDIREVRVATNIAHVVLTRYSAWGFFEVPAWHERAPKRIATSSSFGRHRPWFGEGVLSVKNHDIAMSPPSSAADTTLLSSAADRMSGSRAKPKCDAQWETT